MPKALKKVLLDNGDSPAALDAVVALLSSAKKYGVTPDEAKAWVDLALKRADAFGPRFRAETQINLAELVAPAPALQMLATDLAKKAEADLGADAPTAKQIRVLTVVMIGGAEELNGSNVTTVCVCEPVTPMIGVDVVVTQVWVSPTR